MVRRTLPSSKFPCCPKGGSGGLGHGWARNIVFRFFGRPNGVGTSNRKTWYTFKYVASFLVRVFRCLAAVWYWSNAPKVVKLVARLDFSRFCG